MKGPQTNGICERFNKPVLPVAKEKLLQAV
jgi:hypothetical protein